MEVGCPLWVKDDAKDSELAWVAGVLASKEGPSSRATARRGSASTSSTRSPPAARAARSSCARRRRRRRRQSGGGRPRARRGRGRGSRPTTLKLRNEEGADDVADLITLPHLHEPAILRALEVRTRAPHLHVHGADPARGLPVPAAARAVLAARVLEQFYSRGTCSRRRASRSRRRARTSSRSPTRRTATWSRAPSAHGHGAGGGTRRAPRARRCSSRARAARARPRAPRSCSAT